MKKKIDSVVARTEQRNIQQWETTFNDATIGIVLNDGKG